MRGRWSAGILAGLMTFCCGIVAIAELPGERLCGPADVTAIVGNGRLTAGVNAYGRLSVCRWPSPGYYDQLQYLTTSSGKPGLGVGPHDGAMWALQVNGQTLWLTGAPWTAQQRYDETGAPVIETVCRLESGVVATQSIFVLPGADLLVCHLAVSGMATPPRAFWFANFSPCTRAIPKLPLADWRFDYANDFAVLRDISAQTTYHLRPDEVRGKTEDAARKLAVTNALPQRWAKLGDGVWIGYAARNTTLAAECGLADESESPFDHVSKGALVNTRVAVGQCESAVMLGMDEAGGGIYTATVYIAFGRNMAAVDDLLQQARGKDIDIWRSEVVQAWRDQLAATRMPDMTDADVAAISKQCVRALLTATDAATGAVVYLPITQPPLALEQPATGAWNTWAFDMLGLRESAERHCTFLSRLVRQQDQPDRPLGSMPLAAYTDGEDAAPDLFVDIRATAAYLWSMAKRAESLDDTARAEFLDMHWKAIEAAGEFLTRWKDPVSRLPLPSFDILQLRDVHSDDELVAVYTGMQGMMRLAKWRGIANPEWGSRLSDLDSLVRFRVLDAQNRWRVAGAWRYWASGLVPLTTGVWDQPIQDALAALDMLPREELPEALLALAMLTESRPNQRAMLTKRLPKDVKRAVELPADLPYADSRTPLIVDTPTASRLLLTLGVMSGR